MTHRQAFGPAGAPPPSRGPSARNKTPVDVSRVVPVEVKSGRNVKAKSLARLVREGRTEVAYVLSENNFARSANDEVGCTILHLPLYAAFCIGM